MGLGLGGAKRLSNEFEIESAAGPRVRASRILQMEGTVTSAGIHMLASKIQARSRKPAETCGGLAHGLGFDEQAAEKAAIVVTEACTNLLKHANSGQIVVGQAAAAGGQAIWRQSHVAGNPGARPRTRNRECGGMSRRTATAPRALPAAGWAPSTVSRLIRRFIRGRDAARRSWRALRGMIMPSWSQAAVAARASAEARRRRLRRPMGRDRHTGAPHVSAGRRVGPRDGCRARFAGPPSKRFYSIRIFRSTEMLEAVHDALASHARRRRGHRRTGSGARHGRLRRTRKCFRHHICRSAPPRRHGFDQRHCRHGSAGTFESSLIRGPRALRWSCIPTVSATHWN